MKAQAAPTPVVDRRLESQERQVTARDGPRAG
jgi:hypothetical protein